MAHYKWYLVDLQVCVCVFRLQFLYQTETDETTRVHSQEDLSSSTNDNNISLAETRKALMAEHNDNTGKCCYLI